MIRIVLISVFLLGCTASVVASGENDINRIGVVPFGYTNDESREVSNKLFNALKDLLSESDIYEFIDKSDIEDAFDDAGFDSNDFKYGVPPDVVTDAGEILQADMIVYGFVSPMSGDLFMISWNLGIIETGNTITPLPLTGVGKITSIICDTASDMVESIYSEVVQKAQESLSMAEYHISVENWSMAIISLKQAISIDPGLIDAKLDLANIYLMSNVDSLDNAEVLLNEILAADENNSSALTGLGRIFLAREEFEEALDLFNSAIEADPDNAVAYMNLAATYQELGRLDEAIASFESALSQNPDNLQARYALGLLFFQLESYSDAIPHIEQVLEARPDFQNLRLKLISAYSSTGRYSDAADNCIIVLEAKPDDNNLILFTAQVEARAGRTTQAVNRLENLITSTGMRQAYILLATIYRDSGQRGSMQNVFSRLKNAYPNDPVANYMVGAFYYQSGSAKARTGELVSDNIPLWEAGISELQTAISYLSQVTGYRSSEAQNMVSAATNSISLAEEKIDRVRRYEQ